MEKEIRPKAIGKLDLARTPRQLTKPKEGEPIEIPIPSKADVMDVFKKATRKREKK
jgi:hypothetical protein